MRWPVKIVFDLPVAIRRFPLDEDKFKEFNGGKFARENYKYLYELRIDKGKDKLFVQLATPSFKQILYSLRVLWHAYDGQPYDRHEHPVVMQVLNVEETPMDVSNKNPEAAKEAKAAFRKSYAANRKAR